MLCHWPMPPKWYRAASQWFKDYRDRLPPNANSRSLVSSARGFCAELLWTPNRVRQGLVCKHSETRKLNSLLCPR